MKIRRIVTGHDENGKSVVQWDSELDTRPGREGWQNRGTELCTVAFILIATEGAASTGWA